ncbi:chemokine-like receptor 1, partial [Clarias magur]
FITIMDSVTVFAKDNANLYPQSNYNDTNSSMTTSMPAPESPGCWKDVGCVLVAAAFVVIIVLGITGNGLVIWITGFKIKKTVNNI